MPRMNITISEETEKKLREATYKKYGMKKGNLSKAIEEAINIWSNEGEDE